MKQERWHISKDGQPHRCKAAIGKCPLGGKHYATEEEAIAAAEHQAARNAEPININRMEKMASTFLTLDQLEAYMESEDKLGKLVAASSQHDTALMKMAKDKDPEVRYRVTRNLYAPKEVLELLRNDPNDKVRKQANETYTLLDDADWSISGYMEKMNPGPNPKARAPHDIVEGESNIEII